MIGVNNVGVGQLWTGDLTDAESNLTAGAGLARELRLSLSELSMEAHLSILDVIHGRLNRAQRRAAAIQEIVDCRGWSNEPQVLGLFARGLALLARHQLDAAADAIAAAWPRAAHPRTPTAGWRWASPPWASPSLVATGKRSGSRPTG
jgi:hypothetical protein